ncbi:MAG: sporulation initiation factor Spo0A C-terminal domain-containing protein [Clostridiales bacterium]|jgi:two-component system response regulator (stage 0 sporulation protein A)|nr:sporulation initiation factor Spo0A C-terminal domain-containing protein [Clostridiales bacterium]
MNGKISNYLLYLGFIPNKIGYKYLVDIISMGVKGGDILPLSKNGYVTLSAKYKKSASTIEKDIQNAVSAAWLKGDVDILNEEFGSTIDMKKGKPSNKHFILTAIEKIGYLNGVKY